MSGPQFFQTGYGKRYYDSQLPSLIRALERIADALEENNKRSQENERERLHSDGSQSSQGDVEA